ncbi:MAG: hypothetical protein AVO33_02515 [delta proteobacterium ML8_F1]|nr:MAG: hypothetical protein AVO33_02515 [delta proteobacterium ML8_F1]
MILPITGENFLQMFAGTITMAYMGRVSPLAVGAVGIGNLVFRILWSFFKGLGVGAAAYVARKFGGNHFNDIRTIAGGGVVFAFCSGIVVTVVLLGTGDMLLRVFSDNPLFLGSAGEFLSIIALSLPFAGVILFVSGVLQGTGDARTPMIIVGWLNFVNVILGFLLVFGVGPLPPLGLRGAGYAFLAGHLVAAFMSLLALQGFFRALASQKSQHQDESFPRALLTLMSYGIPTALEITFWLISSIFVSRAILFHGELEYAAYQLALQAESFSYMPAAGIGIAATAFIGQALGGGDSELARAYFKEIKAITLGITLLSAGVLVGAPYWIMRLMTDQSALIPLGATYLFIMGFTQLPQNFMLLYHGVFRGAGLPKLPLANTMIGIWLVRVPTVLFATFVLEAPILWIWLMIVLDLLVRYGIARGLFKRKNVLGDIEGHQTTREME